MPDSPNDQQPVQPEQAGKLSGQSGLPGSSVSTGLTKNIPAILFLFSVVVAAILIISLLAASFPVQPWSPLWYLKLGQIAVDYGVTLFFSLVLSLLSGYFEVRRSGATSEARKFSKRLISFSLTVYLLLVPTQIFGFALHWYQTGQQNRQVIRQAGTEVTNLLNRIRAANTSEQLRAALGAGAEGLPPVPSALLGEQKTKLIESINLRLSQLRTRLNNERQQRLAALSVSTLKGILGAGVIAFGLRRTKQMVVQK